VLPATTTTQQFLSKEEEECSHASAVALSILSPIAGPLTQTLGGPSTQTTMRSSIKCRISRMAKKIALCTSDIRTMQQSFLYERQQGCWMIFCVQKTSICISARHYSLRPLFRKSDMSWPNLSWYCSSWCMQGRCPIWDLLSLSLSLLSLP
jgi:hypothetical protein